MDGGHAGFFCCLALLAYTPRVKTLLWFDVAIYTAILVFLGLHPQRSAHYIAGMLIAALALAFWITARLQLGSSFSVGPQAHKLVTHGLYSRIRNPIYFFGHIALLGAIIAFGWWVLLPIWAFGILFQWMRVKREAAVLETAFGDEYRAYRSQTWF